jgi:hypothetical protein
LIQRKKLVCAPRVVSTSFVLTSIHKCPICKADVTQPRGVSLPNEVTPAAPGANAITVPLVVPDEGFSARIQSGVSSFFRQLRGGDSVRGGSGDLEGAQEEVARREVGPTERTPLLNGAAAVEHG